jgi:hypothetical protein
MTSERGGRRGRGRRRGSNTSTVEDGLSLPTSTSEQVSNTTTRADDEIVIRQKRGRSTQESEESELEDSRLGMALKASNVVGNPVTLHLIW